jgi:hypothetical protein
MHYATDREVAGSTPGEMNEFFFSVYLILAVALGPGVYSAVKVKSSYPCNRPWRPIYRVVRC